MPGLPLLDCPARAAAAGAAAAAAEAPGRGRGVVPPPAPVAPVCPDWPLVPSRAVTTHARSVTATEAAEFTIRTP
nr:hypothetical protein [Deltaproteobacteria bacterium]